MIRIYKEGCYIELFDSIKTGYNIENTLNEIVNGNKYRLSIADKYYLNSLKNGYELIIPDDYQELAIEFKPIIKAKNKSSKITTIKNDNNVDILNNTGEDIPIDSMCGIYSITNIISGRTLIAYSKSVLSRINTNIKKLNKGVFSPANFQDDWNKFGKGGFKYELLKQINNNNSCYLSFFKTKYILANANNYQEISDQKRFIYELLEKLHENKLKFKTNYIENISETERLMFDIMVMNNNEEFQGFVIIDYSADVMMTPDRLIKHNISIQKQIKYCKDNNIYYKLKKI